MLIEINGSYPQFKVRMLMNIYVAETEKLFDNYYCVASNHSLKLRSKGDKNKVDVKVINKCVIFIK